ncbi:cytochrome P450 [Panus rudis PR-1116 ss-1]|nr:cytochrome P450 [Panus rudis PR-1116 ss-1]
MAAAAWIAVAVLVVVVGVCEEFLKHLARQWLTPLRGLPGPPSHSFFMGNLREMHDQENNNLVARWTELYGHTFVYRGFLGGSRLMTTDPVAVSHILGHAYDFPKPDFIRDALASMAAGHDGLLTTEGEVHRRQRKILSPAFSASHIKSLSPIFYRKAIQLRDIWLTLIDTHLHSNLPPSHSHAVADPLSGPVSPPLSPQGSSAAHSALSPPPTTPFLPNPFAGFIPSKALPTPPETSASSSRSTCRQNGPAKTNTLRLRGKKAKKDVESQAVPSPPASPSSSTIEHQKWHDSGLKSEEKKGPKVDVLAWLARATLDTIGEAGFGYAFNSLQAAAKSVGNPRDPLTSGDEKPIHGNTTHEGEPEEVNELARAFGIIFSTARQFRVITILQVWFPILRRFKRNNAIMAQAHATMHRIGMDLINQRSAEVLAEQYQHQTPTSLPADKMNDEDDFDDRLKGRDLLSVLIRSSTLSSQTSQTSTNGHKPSALSLSPSETLSQISTFIAAGHETTSSALTWTLYALSKDEHGRKTQRKLRNVLREMSFSHRRNKRSSPASASLQNGNGSGHQESDEAQDIGYDAILNDKFLDAVVKECLRLHAPVTSTMRVAIKDEVIPLSRPLKSSSSKSSSSSLSPPSTHSNHSLETRLRINAGDIISIPIQAINKSKDVWGPDAEEFRAERWLDDELFAPSHDNTDLSTSQTNQNEGKAEENETKRGIKGVPGLWGKYMLTFLNGNPLNGNRACIGYRFAINEIKIFLYVLLLDIEFSLDDGLEIEKKVNVVTRPCVKNEPHMGNQMPLRMCRVQPEDKAQSGNIS